VKKVPTPSQTYLALPELFAFFANLQRKKGNVSGLADLSPLFLKVPLIANPLTAMASKKVRYSANIY
jgi:hypothetical protein